MSSQLRDLSAHADVQHTSRAEEVSGARRVEHPRGAGFRVLSRLARKVGGESTYQPRHRLTDPDECDAVSVAG
jgi:hypothetical protein